MPKYSVIIPVYNRPEEVRELLESLTDQQFHDFEVLIVEDGSTVTSADVVRSFEDRLHISYFFKENEGQGFARNFGYERASGDYFIVFDSDCLIPPHYLHVVNEYLTGHPVDAFGGPDTDHPSFNAVQKAISHVMTSFFTTGGIRGKKTHVGQYHPRSFNMGISREVFEKTKGYLIPFMGEDLEFSTRIIKSGFKTALIPEAFVYHKRRTDLSKFYKQLKYFGRARINLTRFHPEQLGIIHLFPTFFTLGLLAALVLLATGSFVGKLGVGLYVIYFLLIFMEALLKSRSLIVALLSPVTACIQLAGYGYGLVYEWIRKLRGVDPNTRYTELY